MVLPNESWLSWLYELAGRLRTRAGIAAAFYCLAIAAPAFAQTPAAEVLALHRASPLPFFLEDGVRWHQALIGLPEGDLDLQFLDALIPADRVPLAVMRSYRSARTRAGVFGIGWVSNLDVRLDVDVRTGIPSIQEANGRTTEYKPDGTGRFAPILDPIVRHTLARESDGRWTRKWVSGLEEVFDRQGREVRIARDNDRIQFHYADDASLVPDYFVDAAGRRVNFDYADSLLAGVSDPIGRKTSYRYLDRRLVEVSDALGRKTALRYNAGRLEELSLPDGQSVKIRYATDETVHEITGPGVMATTFTWTRPNNGADRQLVVSLANGTSETLRFGAAILKFQDWGLRDPSFVGADGKAIGLQIRRIDSAGVSASALVVGDKILAKSDGTRATVGIDLPGNTPATLLGSSSPAQGTDDAVAALQSDPAWRSRMTPAAFRSSRSDIRRDAAGRPIEIPAGSAGKETWQWDHADRLIAWTDMAGHKTSYEYDANNHLTGVSEDGRSVTRAQYDVQGLLSRLHDEVSGDTTFAYDSAADLTELRGPGHPTVDLAYDRANRLASVQSSDGSALRIDYDGQGRMASVITRDGRVTRFKYDEQGRLTGESGTDGSSATYSGDANTQAIEARFADGGAAGVQRDASGVTATIDIAGVGKAKARFDSSGRPVSITDSLGVTTTYRYDEKGRLTAKEASDGRSRHYLYDNAGRFAGVRDAEFTSTFSYEGDRATEIIEEHGQKTELHFDGSGKLLSRRTATDGETSYEYEPNGALRAAARADGTRLEYQYDAAGRVASVATSYQGQRATISYAYDSSGRLTSHTREDGTTETFAYDAASRLAERTDRLGNKYRHHYDSQGRKEAIEGPLGVERFKYDASGRISERTDPVEGTFSFEYSDRPDRITIVDQNGARTRVTTNALGQPIETEDALGGKIRREYDSTGRIVAFVDPKGGRTTWSYDDRARSVERHTPLGKVYRNRYDERGNLVEISLPSGQVVAREYDSADRLIREKVGGDTRAYRYDLRGRLASVEGPSGASSYVYDELDRVTEYRDDAGSLVQASYDAVGRRRTVRLPDGQEIRYSYDNRGLLETITTKAGAITYGYDRVGRVSSVRQANGVVVSYDYSAGNRLRSILARSAAGTVLFKEAYEYDSRGNLLTASRDGDIAAPQAVRDEFRRSMGTTRYAYDALNRVVSATYPDGSEEGFTYAADGSVLAAATTVVGANGAKVPVSTAYAYDADQVLVKHGAFAAPPDTDGNFCGDRDRPGCDFGYDALHRLIAWHDQRYRYDGEGRVSDWQGPSGAGGHYVYLDRAMIGETATRGGDAKFYVPGAGPGWSQLSVGDDAYFPIRSPNGSLVAVTDKQGDVVASCLYRTYGAGFSWSRSSTTAGCEFAAGHAQGPGTWFGQRVLHDIGVRFMSPDSVDPDKDGSLYNYALGNPLRFTDITGTAGISVSPVTGLPVMTPLPQSQKALLNKAAQIASQEAGTPAGQVAQQVLDRIASGQLTPRVTNVSSLGMGTLGAAPIKPGNTVARVFMEPIAAQAARFGTQPNVLRQAVATLVHEATHVEQNLAPSGDFEGNPYRRIHELEADLNGWRVDPTMGTGRAMTETDVVDSVARRYSNIRGSSQLRERWVYEGVKDQVDSLRRVRAQQAAEAAERLPMRGVTEAAASDGAGAVERALVREAGELGVLAEKSAARHLAESIFSGAMKYFPGQALKEIMLPGLLELASPLGEVLLVKDLAQMGAMAAAWVGRKLGGLIADPLEEAFKPLRTPEECTEEEEAQQKCKRQRRAAADQLVGPRSIALLAPWGAGLSPAPGAVTSGQHAGAPPVAGAQSGGSASAGDGRSGSSGAGNPAPPGPPNDPAQPPPNGTTPAAPTRPLPPIVNQPLGELPAASTSAAATPPPSVAATGAPAPATPPRNATTTPAAPNPSSTNSAGASTTAPSAGSPGQTANQPASNSQASGRSATDPPRTNEGSSGQGSAGQPIPSPPTATAPASSNPPTTPPANTPPAAGSPKTVPPSNRQAAANNPGPVSIPRAGTTSPDRPASRAPAPPPRTSAPNSGPSDGDQSVRPPADAGSNVPAPSVGIIGALNNITGQMNGSAAPSQPDSGGGLQPPTPPGPSAGTQPRPPIPPTPPTTPSPAPPGPQPQPPAPPAANDAANKPTPPPASPQDDGLPTTDLPKPPPPSPVVAPPATPSTPQPPQTASNDPAVPAPTTPAPITPTPITPTPPAEPAAPSPPRTADDYTPPVPMPAPSPSPGDSGQKSSEGGLIGLYHKVVGVLDWLSKQISGK